VRRRRTGHGETGRLFSERARQRRVVTLVARATARKRIFAAAAGDVARLSGADVAVMLEYDPNGAASALGCWRGSRASAVIGRRLAVAGEGVAVPGLRVVAGERAALRRVVALVAGGAALDAVFAAVAEEAGNVLPEAGCAMVGRYDPGGAVEVAGGWSRAGTHVSAGRRPGAGGQDLSALVFATGQAARAGGGDAVALGGTGTRSAVGVPISVEGRLWGVMIVASARGGAAGRCRGPAGGVHRADGGRDRRRRGAVGAGGLPYPDRRHGR